MSNASTATLSSSTLPESLAKAPTFASDEQRITLGFRPDQRPNRGLDLVPEPRRVNSGVPSPRNPEPPR